MPLSDAIDTDKPVQGNPTTQSVRENFIATKSAIAQLELTAGVGPKGDTGPIGPNGTAASITIGTTTTGAAGTNAAVSNSGTSSAAVLNFTLPRGESGTGGSGITESEAVEAVRKAQPIFEEATVVAAPSWPSTPNVIAGPTLGDNWTLQSGSGATGTYEHAAGDTAALVYALSDPPLSQTSFYQLVFTTTASQEPANGAARVTLYLRFGPTNTSSQQNVFSGIGRWQGSLVFRGTQANLSHLVVVPTADWAGRFSIQRFTLGGAVVNSPSLSIKSATDFPVMVRGNSIAIGNGLGWAQNNAASVAIGYDALARFVGATGANVAIGTSALLNNTTGSNNTAIGAYAMRDCRGLSSSVGIGQSALRNVSSGGNNYGIGYYTGTYWEDRHGAAMNYNFFVGEYAGGNLQSGQHNIAMGRYSMCSWGPPNYQFGVEHNIALGERSLMGGASGPSLYGAQRFNVAIGSSALEDMLDDSHQNVAVGYRAGRYAGSATTGLTHANDSIFIGAQSRGDTNDAQHNQIVIGFNAIGHGSDTITLGNDEIDHLYCNATALEALSDERVKEEVAPADLNRCLDAVKTLPIHRWKWSELAGKHSDQHVTGFMSDEVAKLFPKAVTRADEYRTQRDEHGHAKMKLVKELVGDGEKTEDGGWKAIAARQETREIEDRVLIKDCARVALTEMLPTLWGAVQQIIQRLEALEAQSK